MNEAEMQLREIISNLVLDNYHVFPYVFHRDHIVFHTT